jgi:carbon-monoxide dehydrogenase medium subunit
MTPKRFDYIRVSRVEDAIDFLKKHDDAKVLAGGQSLIALMKLRLTSPAYLVDIGRIREMSYIKKIDSSRIAIGALTTHEEIEDSKLLWQYCPLLPQMASQIGDQQIRNRGTIGGSIVHADPSGDPPAAILALDADLKLVGSEGERTIHASDFFVDTFTTKISQEEILTEITVPSLGRNWFSQYRKYSWRHGDFAIVGFAGLIELEGQTIKSLRVAYASMDRKPIRALKLENELKGKVLSSDLIEYAATDLATEGTNPPSDIHVNSEFRAKVAKHIVEEFLSDALKNFSKSKI